MASLFLNYAENIRRRLRAGFLRSGLEPEGPHNTTAVLSAGGVYHRWTESARRKIHVHGESVESALKTCFSFGEQSCFSPSAGLPSFSIRAPSVSPRYPDPGVCAWCRLNPPENAPGLSGSLVPLTIKPPPSAF